MILRLCIISLIITLSSTFSFSQDKKVDISISPQAEITDVIDLQENGFIVKTGLRQRGTKEVEWQISYYTNDLEKIWSEPIIKTEINKEFDNPIVASSTGNYVYHVEMKEAATRLYNIHITQIKKDGSVKTKSFRVKDFMDTKKLGEIKTVFCNDSYLYILLVSDPNFPALEYSILKFKSNDLSHSYTSSFCKTEEGDMVNIISCENDELIFCKKTFDFPNNKVNFNIIKTDATTKVTSQLTITPNIKEKVFSISVNKRENSNFYPQQTHDLFVKSGELTCSRNAYGRIEYDSKEKTFYCYGMYENESFLNDKRNRCGIERPYEGFYISKYNRDGTLLNTFTSQQIPGSPSPVISTKARSYKQHLTLFRTGDKIELHTWRYTDVYSYTLNKNLEYQSKKVTNYNFNKDIRTINLDQVKFIRDKENKQKVYTYLKGKDSFGNYRYPFKVIYHSNKTIVIQKNEGKCEIRLFNN